MLNYFYFLKVSRAIRFCRYSDCDIRFSFFFIKEFRTDFRCELRFPFSNKVCRVCVRRLRIWLATTDNHRNKDK